MTCSRPQQNVHRPGFEPGTPWSEIRRPNHYATPPPAYIQECIKFIDTILMSRVLAHEVPDLSREQNSIDYFEGSSTDYQPCNNAAL